MPYSDVKARREAVAKSVRRNRMFKAALDSQHPKALEALRAKDNPMAEFETLRAEKDKLLPEERERLKTAAISERLSRANLMRAHADGLSSELYKRLREEVITEMEAFGELL